MSKLTPKQKAFADYYIQTGNATDSALKAGYNKKYASTNTDKLLKNTNLRAYIDERMKLIESSRIADAKEVMEYLTRVMRGEEAEEVAMVVSSGDYCSEIEKTKKEVTPKDRIKAAELIGKRYRMFTDAVDLNATVGVEIIDDV